MSNADMLNDPNLADRAWYQRVAVLAGVWPENDEGNVPAPIVGAIQKYHRAMTLVAPRPKTKTSKSGKGWTEPTTYLRRFGDAMQLLCAGHRPSDALLLDHLNPESDGLMLQEFAVEHGPSWAQGIGLIDAARTTANQPTEGVDHEFLETGSVDRVGDVSEDHPEALDFSGWSECWVIARESAVDVSRPRPERGYEILAHMPSYESYDDAIAALKAANRPLGWVVLTLAQLLQGIVDPRFSKL